MQPLFESFPGPFLKLGMGSLARHGIHQEIISRRLGGGDNSIQFINFGRVGDKSFEEWRQKMKGGGGGRVGDNNILIFSSYCTR